MLGKGNDPIWRKSHVYYIVLIQYITYHTTNIKVRKWLSTNAQKGVQENQLLWSDTVSTHACRKRESNQTVCNTYSCLEYRPSSISIWLWEPFACSLDIVTLKKNLRANFRQIGPNVSQTCRFRISRYKLKCKNWTVWMLPRPHLIMRMIWVRVFGIRVAFTSGSSLTFSWRRYSLVLRMRWHLPLTWNWNISLSFPLLLRQLFPRS